MRRRIATSSHLSRTSIETTPFVFRFLLLPFGGDEGCFVFRQQVKQIIQRLERIEAGDLVWLISFLRRLHKAKIVAKNCHATK